MKSKYPYLSRRKCLLCKERILIEIPKNKTKRFCSMECYGISKRVTHNRTCKCCGKSFTTNNMAEINRGHAQYCSNECKVRKFTINEDYFTSIDIPEKAYCLGYLWSSASAKDFNRIKISSKDESELDFIVSHFNSNYPVKKGRDGMFYVKICSTPLIDSLTELGFIIGDKSNIEVPKIDVSLKSDFIRGYFDSYNGFVYPEDGLNVVVMHTESRELCEYIYEATGGNIHRKYAEWIIMITDSKEFYNFIYGSGPYLVKKKDKFNV